MNLEVNTTVRMFGALHSFRTDQGLEPRADVAIPEEGMTAHDIALELGLPMEKIEAVFINHKVYSLDHLVMPGDRVALVPTGIPGPHRFLLGIFDAGKEHHLH